MKMKSRKQLRKTIFALFLLAIACALGSKEPDSYSLIDTRELTSLTLLKGESLFLTSEYPAEIFCLRVNGEVPVLLEGKITSEVPLIIESLAGITLAESGLIVAPSIYLRTAQGEIEIRGKLRAEREIEIEAEKSQVKISGEIRSGLNTFSGMISLVARDIYLSLNALLQVTGSGTINIRSTQITEINGCLEAKGLEPDQRGGLIAISGKRVGLLETLIDVSGQAGGGQILVGGGLQGRDSSILNSLLSYVSKKAILRANGSYAAKGGSVVVWSDGKAAFYGRIDANGLVGGFAEISGKRDFQFQGLAGLKGFGGRAGTLLLDPTDITISNNPDTPTMTWNTDHFEDTTTTPSNLNITTLTTQLNSSNVIVSTTSGLGGNGDITVVDTISYGSNNDLTLNALHDIIVNASITNTGSGSIIFNAGVAISLTAVLITTNGGNISFNNNVNLSGDVTLDTGAGAGNIAINGGVSGAGQALSLTAGAGDILLYAVNVASLSFGATSGTLTLNGNVTVTNGFDTSNVTGAIIVAGATVITTTNTAVVLNTAVTLNAGLTVSTGGGNISINSAVNGDSPGLRSLSLDAGAGSVSLTGPIGTGVALLDLNIIGGASFNFPSTAVTGNITATVSGDITDSGQITCATMTLACGTANITLNEPTNTIPALTIQSQANLTLVCNNSISLITTQPLTGLNANVSALTLASLLTVSGNIIVAGGSLDVSTANYPINLTGDWTVAPGAIFNARNATLTFSGALQSTLDSGGADANHDFYNLTISAGKTVQLGPNPVLVTGTLNIMAADSVLDCVDMNFTFNSISFNGANGVLEVTGEQTVQQITNPDLTAGTIRYYAGSGSGLLRITNFYNLEIAGGNQSLTSASEIHGNLIVNGGNLQTQGYNLTVYADYIQNNGSLDAGSSSLTLRNNFIINSGSFNASSSHIYLSGDFDTSGAGSSAFNPGTGTVEFVNHNPPESPDVSVISGSNSFYNFVCHTDSKEISFTTSNVNIPRTTTILAGGNFEIRPTSGSMAQAITLKATVNPGAPYPNGPVPDFSGGAIPEQWILDLNTTANRLIEYVRVDLSWAVNPIVINEALVDINAPGSSPAVSWCYNWGNINPVVQNITYDIDDDGKIEIYVRTLSSLNDDFSDFHVHVDGYLIDPDYAASNGCDTDIPNDDRFIIRLRRDRTASGVRLLDTDARPTWRITANTSLLAQGTTNKLVGPVDVTFTPQDTVSPRFGYSLAPVGGSQVFIYFSEPVAKAGGLSLTAADFTITGHTVVDMNVITSLSSNPNYVKEILLTLASPVTGNDVITPATISFAGGVDVRDQANNPFNTPSHRISDLLLGLPGQEALRPSLLYDNTPREPGPEGVGYVTVFDGTGFIQDYNTEQVLQADFAGISEIDVRVVWDTNIASNYKFNSLWLPNYNYTTGPTGFNGLVPVFNPNTDSVNNQGVADPIQFRIDTSHSELEPSVLVEFFLYCTTQDLYCARLTRPAASDWYRSVRPWAFGIVRPGGQKGGVTIFNNVINPVRGEQTRIHYVLSQAGYVTIQIFSLNGDLVRVLYSGQLAAGEHSTAWDGRNASGAIVARGLYFIRISGPGVFEMRKVLVVK